MGVDSNGRETVRLSLFALFRPFAGAEPDAPVYPFRFHIQCITAFLPCHSYVSRDKAVQTL
jgi:hypothetical protein